MVVFSAPQLSLVEMQSLAAMLDGRRADIPLFAVTSPQVKPDADRMGLTARIEAAGGTVLVRHVLLSELCARNGGGERLARSRHQFGQAHQHPRRLWLSAGAAVDGRMRSGGLRRRKDSDERENILRRRRHGPEGQAQALVASDGFSARYDLDRIRGVFSRPEHKLAGESYRGRVLVLDAAKGGVATAWMLHEMSARGIMPAALVLNRANPIMVQGAALADFTMISGFDVDITTAIANGAEVEVDPTAERPFIRVVRV